MKSSPLDTKTLRYPFLFLVGSYCYAFNYYQCAKLDLNSGRWTWIPLPTTEKLSTMTIVLLEPNGCITPVYPGLKDSMWTLVTETDTWIQLPTLNGCGDKGDYFFTGQKSRDVNRPNEYMCWLEAKHEDKTPSAVVECHLVNNATWKRSCFTKPQHKTGVRTMFRDEKSSDSVHYFVGCGSNGEPFLDGQMSNHLMLFSRSFDHQTTKRVELYCRTVVIIAHYHPHDRTVTVHEYFDRRKILSIYSFDDLSTRNGSRIDIEATKPKLL